MDQSNLASNARSLRRNMTKEERHLWYDFLKTLPLMVHRQKVIGPYIVDFYIASASLVIELDGSQHYEEKNVQKDLDRDSYLRSKGLKILRYPNNYVNSRFREVCQDIWQHLALPEELFSPHQSADADSFSPGRSLIDRSLRER